MTTMTRNVRLSPFQLWLVSWLYTVAVMAKLAFVVVPFLLVAAVVVFG
jgi:hypothetical protein